MFLIGSVVKIINKNYTYSTYSEAAKKMNAVNYKKEKLPRNNAIGKITNSMIHPEAVEKVIIYLVHVDGKDFVMSGSGLEVVFEAGGCVCNPIW